MTFSIVATDGEFCGAAISTRTVAVGSTCLNVVAGCGAVSSQAWTNPLLGLWAQEALAAGSSATEALSMALARDPEPEQRQLLVASAAGGVAAHTGDATVDYSGQLLGPDCAVAGNMLVGEETLTAMMQAFTASDGPLEERLVQALRAGQDAGGDRRGRQSAALLVVKDQPYPWLDLRVDEHEDPVTELERILGKAKVELLPFISAFPTVENPRGNYTEELRASMTRPDS